MSVRPYYSFWNLLPHREKEPDWSCAWPDCGAETWTAILHSQGFRCFYCTACITPETAAKDHLHPISRGGCRCCGNVVAACDPCNRMKGNHSLRDFLRLRPVFLHTMGEFSTRILYFQRDHLFWDHFRAEIHRLSTAKRMPDRVRPTPENINARKLGISL